MAAVYRFLDQLLLRHEWGTCCPSTRLWCPAIRSHCQGHPLLADSIACRERDSGMAWNGSNIGLLGLEGVLRHSFTGPDYQITTATTGAFDILRGRPGTGHVLVVGLLRGCSAHKRETPHPNGRGVSKTLSLEKTSGWASSRPWSFSCPLALLLGLLLAFLGEGNGGRADQQRHASMIVMNFFI